MKILSASLAAFALLGLGATASAFPGGGGPLPSVAKQVRAEAKADGILKGLVKPSVRLQYSANGKAATAMIMSMSKFNGTPKGLPKAERMLTYTAKFKIGQVMEGRIAAPVKQAGRIWLPIER